jgi:hypothetical protein
MATPSELPQDPWDYSTDQVVVVLGNHLDENQANVFRKDDITGGVLMWDVDDKALKEELGISSFGKRVAIRQQIVERKKVSEKWKQYSGKQYSFL